MLWKNDWGINGNKTEEATIFSEGFEGYVPDDTDVVTALSPLEEITAIPALLELLDLAGSIITIDAMGTQTA